MTQYANVFHALSVDGSSGTPHGFDTLFMTVSLVDIFDYKWPLNLEILGIETRTSCYKMASSAESTTVQ